MCSVLYVGSYSDLRGIGVYGTSCTKEPRMRLAPSTFEVAYFFRERQGGPDFIDSLQEMRFADGIHFELNAPSRRTGDRLPWEIDFVFEADLVAHLIEKSVHRFASKDDWQESIFEAVVAEDVSKTRSNQHTESVLLDSPW